MKHLVFSLVLLVFPGLGLAQADTADLLLPAQVQRERLELNRSQEESRYKLESQACYQRFAVNDCLATARTRHYAVTGLLRRQELSLNAAEREKKGDQARQRIVEKSSPAYEQEHADKREAARLKQLDLQQRAQQKTQNQEQAVNRAQEAVKASNERLQRQERAAADREQAAQLAVQKEKDFEAKQRQAQEHKEEVQKKMAEDPKRSAQPLPAGR